MPARGSLLVIWGRRPLLVLLFYGHASSEHTRGLVILATSLFHGLTVDVCPWSSRFVTMRCSLEHWLLFNNISEIVFNTSFLLRGSVLLYLVAGHWGGLGGLTVLPCLCDISEGEKWVLQDGTLPPQGVPHQNEEVPKAQWLI